MKRKISLLMVFILLLSMLTTAMAAENTSSDNKAEETELSAENKTIELSMDEAVKLAVENSRDMWKIDDGIRQAQDAKRAGRDAKELAEDLMNLSLEEIAGMKAVTQMDPLSNYVETLMAKNGYYIKLADTQMLQLGKNREVLLKGIEIQIKSLYYDVLLSEKTIEINQAKLNKANEQLRVVNLKFSNGSATKADVLNGELAVQQAKTDLDSAMDDLSISKLNLLNKLNLPFDTEFILTDKELTYIPSQGINIEDIIAEALEQRPEILSANNDLELQKIETHVYTAYYTSNLRQNKAAKEKLKDAEFNIPKRLKDVELDVRSTYLNLIKAERAFLNMEKTLELSKEAARINKLLFDNGMATPLDVMNADTNLAQAEIGKYQLLAAYNMSKLMLDNSYIIGGK